MQKYLLGEILGIFEHLPSQNSTNQDFQLSDSSIPYGRQLENPKKLGR